MCVCGGGGGGGSRDMGWGGSRYFICCVEITQHDTGEFNNMNLYTRESAPEDGY